VLNIAFRVADEQGLLLLDLKDLRALLQLVAENAKELTTSYGNVSKQSVGAIQRQLLVLENQRGDEFLGEPALDIGDLIRTDRDGRGIVNILAAEELMNNPRLYATFLLWLMSELFEELPEVGDLDKPKLVFFFDEAHLLFADAPPALVDAVERVVRLIRSKGVGVYFITQNPADVPESVLPSSATGCSTPCAPSPRATRGRCGPRPRRSGRTPPSTRRRSSPSSRSARRSSRPLRAEARRPWCSGR
jgi:DNA helicase HerA-like ATPase